MISLELFVYLQLKIVKILHLGIKNNAIILFCSRFFVSLSPKLRNL